MNFTKDSFQKFHNLFCIGFLLFHLLYNKYLQMKCSLLNYITKHLCYSNTPKELRKRHQMQNLKHQMHNLKQLMQNLKQQMQNLKHQMQNLKRQMQNLKRQMQNLKHQMQNLKLKMHNLKLKMQKLKRQMQNLKRQMQNFKRQMQNFKRQKQNLKHQKHFTQLNQQIKRSCPTVSLNCLESIVNLKELAVPVKLHLKLVRQDLRDSQFNLMIMRLHLIQPEQLLMLQHLSNLKIQRTYLC